MLFRATHCGMQENDVLLGEFAKTFIDDFNDAQLAAFERLLDENDNDIFTWLTAETGFPKRLDEDFMNLIIKYKNER
ncbi:succinate dehydrogenase assembly factor 2 [Varunaivibrio sulfuroxidans]|uniref:FAD assembly factor SdhE n=1 Tax=Varunaivibrio sulfuroxidans TaxID=1773489 RepID=A0A4R3JFW6_9PROT|nr:succinate dehydrogenase assembly factor 2 [Varunaivibrio sulfuroxidans]TCS64385.1 antitoxin CptB [Varunaivibrio sulfuroxidans]WES31184.1 succinate dehydrogenase assembly factor 2 [Varunaivibrio sulfuroxidans]